MVALKINGNGECKEMEDVFSHLVPEFHLPYICCMKVVWNTFDPITNEPVLKMYYGTVEGTYFETYNSKLQNVTVLPYSPIEMYFSFFLFSFFFFFSFLSYFYI